MSHFIAVDIGRTQMRAGYFRSGNLTPSKIERVSTRHPSMTPLERLFGLIESTWPKDGCVDAIGVAAAGPLDSYAGIVREAPNIPGWVDIPLRKYLEDRFNVTVALGNDANLAAMGEWKFGAGQGHHYLIYITVSTGIGGGVIIAERLLLGANGLAAELGHITVVPGGPMCGCGQRGHLEALASGPAIASWVEQELSQGVPSSLKLGTYLTAKQIGEAALQGDSLAIAAISRAGSYLGQAIADFLHIFNPTIVIIGGGVSQMGDLLLNPIRATVREHVLSPYYVENLTITTAALGDNAGLMGALALAQSVSIE